MNDNTPLVEPMLACKPRPKSSARARVRLAAKPATDAHLILPLSIAIIGAVSIFATLAGL